MKKDKRKISLWNIIKIIVFILLLYGLYGVGYYIFAYHKYYIFSPDLNSSKYYYLQNASDGEIS